MDKTYRTEIYRAFLIEALPEPLTPAISHLQIFDNYIAGTRLRLRSIRNPETRAWTRILQQRLSVEEHPSLIKIAEIYLDELEYEHFRIFEGNEIRKNRYFHEFDGRNLIFDIYLGELWGLNIAKTEFAADDELLLYEPPFAVIEITQNPFFAGEKLVGRSFAEVRAEVEKS